MVELVTIATTVRFINWKQYCIFDNLSNNNTAECQTFKLKRNGVVFKNQNASIMQVFEQAGQRIAEN